MWSGSGLWKCQEIPTLPLLATELYLHQVLASLTPGFQFLNWWEGSQNKSTETTQVAVGIRGTVSEGSETPTRELACRLGQAEWWSRLSGVRWEPRHLASLLCWKRHRSKTNQMAQQLRALPSSLATWVGIPRTLPVEGEKRNPNVVPWPSQTCLYILTSQSPMVYMCNCRVGRTFVKCDSQKVTQLQIFKSVGAEVGCSQATVHHSRAEDRGLHYTASEIWRFTWSSQLVLLGSKERVVVLFSSHWLFYFWKSKWPIRRVAIFHEGLLSMKQYFGVILFQLGKPQVCFVFIF